MRQRADQPPPFPSPDVDAANDPVIDRRPPPEEYREPSFDRFAQIYLVVLLTLIGAGVLFFWQAHDERLTPLNERLAADAQLAAYPYTFEVQELDGSIAVVSSPHAAGLSVIHFLRTAFPEMRAATFSDPGVEAGQIQLMNMHSRVERLLVDDPNVSGVRWEVDEGWYRRRGVFLEYFDQ